MPPITEWRQQIVEHEKCSQLENGRVRRSTQSWFFAFLSPLVSGSKLGSTCFLFANSPFSMERGRCSFFHFVLSLQNSNLSHIWSNFPQGVDPPCGSLCSGSGDQNMSRGQIYGELNTHIAAGIPPTLQISPLNHFQKLFLRWPKVLVISNFIVWHRTPTKAMSVWTGSQAGSSWAAQRTMNSDVGVWCWRNVTM